MAEGGKIGDAVKWVEKHPYATAGGVFVLGAIVIYIYYSGGSTTPAPQQAAGSDTSLLQAELASNAQNAQLSAATTQAQLQASTAGQAINGQVQLGSIQVQGSVDIAGLESTTQSQEIAANESVSLAQILASENVQEAGLNVSYQTQLANDQASEATTNALVGYLNNSINDQYSYLNNQVNSAETVDLAQLGLEAETLLSNTEYTQIENQVGTIENQVVNTGSASAGVESSLASLWLWASSLGAGQTVSQADTVLKNNPAPAEPNPALSNATPIVGTGSIVGQYVTGLPANFTLPQLTVPTITH